MIAVTRQPRPAAPAAGSGPRRVAGRRPGAGPRVRPRAPRAVRDELGHRDRRPLHAGRHWPASTRSATSAGRASTRSPAASSRRCTAAASGRCASTPASPRPPRRTSASATSSSRARPACRWPSTCRPRWATTPTRRRRAGEVGRVGVPISSLADMETLFADIPLGDGQHVDDDQRDGGDPARPLRGGRRAPGRRPGARSAARSRTTSSRSTSRAAPRSTRPGPSMRLVTDIFEFGVARAAPLEHDQHQRLPHARGRGDGRPGARLHARRRDRLLRRRGQPRPRHRRLRRPAVLLLRRLERAVRGGRQVPGGPPDVGADRARSASGRRTSAR